MQYVKIISVDDLESNLLIENDVTLAMGNVIDHNAALIQEINNYLCKKCENDVVAGLKDFPNIRRIYCKYNSIRSTEALCERMFSYAGNETELYMSFVQILFNCAIVYVILSQRFR